MAGSKENILLIQLGDIGDVVLTTPCIRAVKETCPGCHLTIVVRKPYGGLLSGDPFLDEIIEVEKGEGLLESAVSVYRRLRMRRYDLAVHLRTGDRGVFLTLLSCAKERVGCHIGGKQFWHDWAYTKVIRCFPPSPPGGHPGAEQSLRILRAIGIVTTDSTPRLYVTEPAKDRAVRLLRERGLEPVGRWVSINPFSRWQYKEWNDAKWMQVIDHLWRQHGLSTVVVGSTDESARAAMLVCGRERYAHNLAGKTTLAELAALLSMSLLHLGVDSAAPHIAAAVGTSTITIHGPTDWRSWRVTNDCHRIVTVPLECVPCRKKGCDDTERSRCLDELSVEQVLSVTAEMLTGRHDHSTSDAGPEKAAPHC